MIDNPAFSLLAPLLESMDDDEINEERRKKAERGDAGLTLLSGSSMTGKPLLASTLVNMGGGM